MGALTSLSSGSDSSDRSAVSGSESLVVAVAVVSCSSGAGSEGAVFFLGLFFLLGLGSGLFLVCLLALGGELYLKRRWRASQLLEWALESVPEMLHAYVFL